jgi:hypothetical protein
MNSGRRAFALTLAGFGWAIALIGAAFVVPVYSGVSGSSTTAPHTFSSTLVEENGLSVLVPLAIPAALAALVWLALHRRCSRETRWSGPVAWALIGLLGAFSVVTSLTVGLFVMPVALLLAGAAVSTPVPAR